MGRNRKNAEAAKKAESNVRRCQFETMEPRRVLSADPVVIGVTYHEGDGGQDTIPDYFQVTFQGGSPTTQLNTFTINGDKDATGSATRGDMIFDVGSGGPGVDGFHAFTFDAANSIGVTASDVTGWRVSDDGTSLTVDVKNFMAGDKLAFTLDVDEIEHFSLDPIASGVEFEGSQLSATFFDPHYTFVDRTVSVDVPRQTALQNQQSGTFYDYYDKLVAEGSRLAGDTINLRADNDLGQQNRSAGTVDVYDLVPKPITISGHVYHDENINCVQDPNESGIGGVKMTLQLLNNATGQYQNVATTSTNANGFYEFGLNLNLQPGTYRVVETQPAGFLDVGASAGTVAGTPTGTVTNDAGGHENIIAGITIPLGGTAATDYDFKEVRPAKISGHVWHDRNDNGRIDSGEEGIANVLIQVTRVGAKDGVVKDPFANSTPIFVRTAADGSYSVDGLPPGIYEVVEINNYPVGANPLAPYLDGKDAVGTVGGTRNGTALNDRFNQITLCAGDAGVNYDFGELKPNTISGHVGLTTPEGDCIDPASPNYKGISGVTIQLLDQSGNIVGTTQTNANGLYEFTGLRAGTYTIVEVQPNGHVDAGETVGKVDGRTTGSSTINDRFSGITLVSGQSGASYDFCENIPAEVCGTVYHDRNNNGKQDAGEEGIAGARIVLKDLNGNIISEKLTDANGDYCFKDLIPGEYCISEIQPTGYLDGIDSIGKVNGVRIGTGTNDAVCNLILKGGEKGVDYDFGEIRAAEICGTVYFDRNNNGVQDTGEEGIAGTRVVLKDVNGIVISEKFTDAKGEYCFKDLIPGEYCITETQPASYLDGIDSVGKVNGNNVGLGTNDQVCKITLTSGQKGGEYNFGEIRPASIAGYTLQDSDGNCRFEASKGDKPIVGTTIQLLDANGNILATTKTGADGGYKFDNLRPGDYSVRQIQPGNYFTVAQRAGLDSDGAQGSGDASTDNLIANVTISSGQNLSQYNFCEEIPAEIHGRVWEDGPAFKTFDGKVPDNYRSQRDGIYQAGIDTPLSGVKMQLYWYINPAEGLLIPSPVKLSEVMPGIYNHLGSDPNAAVWVTTDANGLYSFTGLRPGTYIVLESQPSGYVDANEVVGSTTGFSYNSAVSAAAAPLAVLSTFSTAQVMDSIVAINVQGGGISIQNNFTEVRAELTPDTPKRFIPDPPPPRVYGNPPTPGAPLGGIPGLAGSTSVRVNTPSYGAAFQVGGTPQAPFTWHLSVVNAGQPRAVGEMEQNGPHWLQAAFIGNNDWDRFDMNRGEWSFATTADGKVSDFDRGSSFGMLGGVPLAGDFDGDGIDEVAIFHDGYWMIDINRNGRWDRDDLLARLGDADDSPVVGDWDNDGKDDIGIYGPIWERDPEAIANDPGLPNPENRPMTRPKNIPPMEANSTSGARYMKLTAYGQQRADLVDHVFGIDDHRMTPVTGDWNGNGIRSIGTFEGGQWRLDINGDGRFDENDSYATFGRSGDVPLVGDFNGDGIDEIAIFRSGTWIIDADGDYREGIGDTTLQFGDATDMPVTGDWNGDGIDEIATWRSTLNNIQVQ